MEDDIDIYEDLPSFQAKHNENFIGNNEKDIIFEQAELKKQISELTVKLEDFQKVNKNLEVNLISLLKTAKAEIARKDMMIDDLRRKLDDATFKRGIYSKANKNDNCSSTVSNTIINDHSESTDSCFSPKDNKYEITNANLSCKQIKEQQSKCTMVPITVFGERLHKRIIDEQNLETKDKLNKFNVSNINNNHNIGSTTSSSSNNKSKGDGKKYIAESDKENGSLSSANFCTAKNPQTSVVTQYTERECAKNPLTESRIAAKEESKSETDDKIHQLSVVSVKCMGKRAPEEMSRNVSIKRIKYDEKNLMDLTKKEHNDYIFGVYNDTPEISKDMSTESYFCKKRYAINTSGSGYFSNPNINVKKYQHWIYDNSSKIDEKKDSKKESNISCDNKAINGRSFKRQNKSTDEYVKISSTSRLDENYISRRYLKSLKRDNHRGSIDHRREKQKEDRYTDNVVDHRLSRSRGTPYTKYEEEKYRRSPYLKYTSYGDRYEKWYDYRGFSEDKSKPINKESYSTRDDTKRSSDRRANSLKRNDYYEEYECKKLRGSNKKAKLVQEKQDECDELRSHQRGNVEKFKQRSKNCQILRQSEGNSSYSMVGEVNRICELKMKLKHYRGPEKCTKESKSSFSDLEEGEIINYSNKINECKKSTDTENATKEISNVLSSIDTINPKYECKSVTNKLVGKPKISFHDISHCCDWTNLNVNDTCLIKQDRTKTNSPVNIEANESVENVENIEKFIRELTSGIQNHEKIHETAFEIVHTENADLEKKVVVISKESVQEKHNIVNSNHLHNRDTTCSNLIEQIVQQENEKDKTSEKVPLIGSENTCLVLSKGVNFITSDSHIETQTKQPDHDKSFLETVLQNSIELPKNYYVSKHTTNEETLEHQLKKFAENDLSSNKSSYSRFPTSLLRTLRETTDTESSTVVDTSDDNNNATQNRHIEDHNYSNQLKIERNDPVVYDTTTENKDLNSIATMKMEQKKKNDKDIIEEEKEKAEKGGKDNKKYSCEMAKSSIQITSMYTRSTSLNIDGKIVIFARRKKPVCLVNNNANMTVIMDNKKQN